MEDLKQKGMELLMAGLSVILGIKPVLCVIGLLIAIDFFLGSWVSLKKGETFSSKKMSNTVTKAIIYHLFIISAFLIEKFIITQLPLLEISAGFIALIELTSISESAFYLTGINFFASLKKLLKREGSKIGIDAETVENVSDILEETKKNIKQKDNETI